ncbi:hypothetical protein MKX01_027735 [Papaver californicum]|nr:hypothetical protein MKX01_027735 [Papaver californicum]
MVNIPKDILLDILVRLPIKSVSQFRCVDKAWSKLLGSPKFLKMHDQRAMEMNVNYGLMLHNHNDVYSFSYDPSSSTCKGINHVTRPVRSYQDGIEFFGCCNNGLVLLRHVSKYYSHVLILWNPTTNECKKVPFPTFHETEQCLDYVEYGIGYSSRRKDFRVVAIGNFEGSFEVMVYSLKKNKWKADEELHLDNLDHRKIPDMARMPVNRALHWIADIESMTLPSEDPEVILCFDIENEQFNHLPLPDLFDENSETSLYVLGGSLCLLGFDPEVGAAVWELKQDGAEKKWTKLFTIDLQKIFGGLVENLMPLQSLKDGNIMLGLDMDSGFHIVSYDLKHDTTRILNVQAFQKAGSFHTSVFGESQVSVNTGTYLKYTWQTQIKKMTTVTRRRL